MAAPDPIRELHDLAIVHRFYVELLQSLLGCVIPLPNNLLNVRSKPRDADFAGLRNWLSVLDLATSAPMLRDALKPSVKDDTVVALLRYFAAKRARTETDRDKADYVATFLYRCRVPQPSLTLRESAEDPAKHIAAVISSFEEQLQSILADSAPAQLPMEHRQLAREFAYLLQQVEDFRSFEALIESGMIQRVRELKRSFGPAFYHPHVLARVAAYNVFFGASFDRLLREAVSELKAFAAQVEHGAEGAPARAEDDATLQQVSQVDENRLLTQEYTNAQEQFRKVSKAKKALDHRRGSGAGGRKATQGAAGGLENTAKAGSGRSGLVPRVFDYLAAPLPGGGATEVRVRGTQEQIRSFIQAADPRFSTVVPLRNGNMTLTTAEVAAFRIELSGERSFRADYHRLLTRMVALQAQFLIEMDDYVAKKQTAYLWKPHADALAYLIGASQQALQLAAQVQRTAEQRGLEKKVVNLRASMEKLQNRMHEVAGLLRKFDAGPPRAKSAAQSPQ
jgi:hypothetical protein